MFVFLIILRKTANNIFMIYLVGFISGILNGLFASGSGQIIIFYLIFILKIQSHIGRGVSIAVLTVASVITAIGYSGFVKFDILKILIISLISILGGLIGSKLMDKINAKVLNLMSGIIITGLSIYSFFK